MARPIDPDRHQARRLQIIDAGLTVFSRQGYAGTTTAGICREAGISSGTFFHYFPKKSDLLEGILQLSLTEAQEFFAQRAERTDPLGVIWEYVDHELADLEDPRAAGFISAVNSPGHGERVQALLAELGRNNREALTQWLDRAQQAELVRTDLSAGRLAAWVMVIIDGFAGQVGTDESFEVAVEKPLLYETLRSLLKAS